MPQTILTTNEVAARLNVDPKTLRKFFRSDKCNIEPVGQGRRYALTAADVRGMTKAFEAWRNGKVTLASTPATEAKKPNRKVDSTKKPTTRKTTKKAAPEPEVIEELEEVTDAVTNDELSLDDDALTDAENHN